MKEIVKLLLAKDQVDPDSKSSVSPASTGMTPLSYTAKSGHTAIVKLLLDTHGIDPFPEDSESYAAPLLCAVWERYVEVVKLLLDKAAADTRSVTSNRNSLLCLAMGDGHDEVIKLLFVAAQTSPNSQELKPSLLPYAAKHGSEAAVRILLATGRFDPDSKYADYLGEERTGLSYAAEEGHAGIVKLLLATGRVDINFKYWERTPLCLAAEKGHDAVVKLLLADNPDFSAGDWI
jgi:ankyrin repeat protein